MLEVCFVFSFKGGKLEVLNRSLTYILNMSSFENNPRALTFTVLVGGCLHI